MKQVLVPYTFKLDEDLVIGDNNHSPEFVTHIDKKFINKIVGQCIGKSIYVDKHNSNILLKKEEGGFEPNCYDNPNTQSVATVASYTYTGLWLDVPDSMVDTLKDFDIKVTFRWTCISDQDGCHVDSISDVSFAYEPDDENSYLKSFIKPGCKYILI